MKANQILKALNIVSNKYTKTHCSKLADIYSVLVELTKTSKFTAAIVENETLVYIGRTTEIYYPHYYSNGETRVLFDGVEMKAAKINFKTDKQDYSFTLPINNAFFDAVCNLLQIEFKGENKANTSELNAVQTISVSSEILSSIKKAAKFVTKDSLRPAMQCVMLHIKDNILKVVSTDAHRLYYSKGFSVNLPDELKIMLTPDATKTIIGIKAKNENVVIDILPSQVVKGEYYDTYKHYALFEGVKVELWQDEKFPDYECVIPKLETKMIFNRVEFVDKIKQVIPYANKATNQVYFHLNGKIEMTCLDVDYGFEATREMNYLSKDFIDTDIAFNGKFLIDTLSIFKAKEITMLSNGKPTQCGLFTDGIETVLIMPLMIHKDYIEAREEKATTQPTETKLEPEIKPELSKVMYVCSSGKLRVKNGNFTKRIKRSYLLAA